MTAKLPSRLHHTAYETKDLEATRHFYEDIIGLPLVAKPVADLIPRSVEARLGEPGRAHGAS